MFIRFFFNSLQYFVIIMFPNNWRLLYKIFISLRLKKELSYHGKTPLHIGW